VKADLLSLPFPDGHADRIVAVHVFEHFYRWDAKKFLAECLRVLKPGGRIALELPCMDKVFAHIYVRMTKGKPPSPKMSWLAIWGSPNEGAHMAHKWGYFKSDMVSVLAEAGFTDIKHEEPNYHFPVRDMRVTATKPTEI
jgi:predicted SAM-dependent methyltransferase